jgi:putative sigma-54 modulation protein
MYASIDLVVDKLERQIRSTRPSLARRSIQEALVPENFSVDEPIDESEDYKVVRTKRFPLKPMHVDEGHSSDEPAGTQLLCFHEC